MQAHQVAAVFRQLAVGQGLGQGFLKAVDLYGALAIQAEAAREGRFSFSPKGQFVRFNGAENNDGEK